jgi:hypothetical protein
VQRNLVPPVLAADASLSKYALPSDASTIVSKGDRERSTENVAEYAVGRPICKDSGSQKHQNCNRRCSRVPTKLTEETTTYHDFPCRSDSNSQVARCKSRDEEKVFPEYLSYKRRELDCSRSLVQKLGIKKIHRLSLMDSRR